MSLLNSIMLVPIAALAILLLLPSARLIRWVCALSGLVNCVLSALLWHRYDSSIGGIQFAQVIPWVEGVGISYHVGVDGFNTVLIALNSIVYFTGVLTMWDLRERVKE